MDNSDLDYHEHDHLTDGTYEEHAHAGNTPGHDHPDQQLGPRYERPLPSIEDVAGRFDITRGKTMQAHRDALWGITDRPL